jgi:hypothetical protein
MDGYRHYIRVDANNIIIYGFSDAFEDALPTDICIAENAPRHFHLTFSDSLVNEKGVYKYKWVNNQIVERPQSELYPLDYVKADKLSELQKARDAEIFSSFKSSALGTQKTYNYDKEAYENFRGRALLLSLNPNITTVNWATIEDGFVNHTKDQFLQVISDGATHEESAKMKYFQLEAQVKAININANTTYDQAVAQIQAIVW